MGNKTSNNKSSEGNQIIFNEIKENTYNPVYNKKFDSNQQLIKHNLMDKYKKDVKNYESTKHYNKIYEDGKVEMEENPIELNYNFRYVSTNEDKVYYKSSLTNNFVGTLLDAYNDHIPLELKPDHVWFSIMSNLSHYIDKNSEKFRSQFVDFDGKKELSVETQHNVLSTELDDKTWSSLVDQMHNLIKLNINNGLAEWSIPDFSTTTEKDKLIGKFILMATCKHYFSYGFRTCCGIPKITLLGTVDDWILLKDRLNKFDIFGDENLSDWKTKLCEVLDHFIQSYSNPPDIEFWGKIMSVKSTFGSGASTYYSGWSTVFNPFSEYGRYLLTKDGIYQTIDVDDINTSYVTFDVTLDDGISKLKAKGIVGCFGELYESSTNTLSPAFEFALLD